MTTQNHMNWEFRECDGQLGAIVTLNMTVPPGGGITERDDGNYDVSLSLHVPPFHVEVVWGEKRRMERAMRQRDWTKQPPYDKKYIPRLLREWCDFLTPEMQDLEPLLVAASEELEQRGAVPITMGATVENSDDNVQQH